MKPGISSGSPVWMQGPEELRHPPLLSTLLEVEQLRHKSVPIWEASAGGRSLAYYAKALAPVQLYFLNHTICTINT